MARRPGHAYRDEMPVVIYSSIRGQLTAIVTPAILIAIGTLGVAIGGPNVIAIFILFVGVILAIGTLIDYPRRSEFTDSGIDRVAFLRRHHLDWVDIEQLDRTNPFLIGRRFRRSRRIEDEDEPKVPRGAGLVAVNGRRRYLLTNAREGRDEFDQLAALVKSAAPEVKLLARRPAQDAAPSSLYRRRRRA